MHMANIFLCNLRLAPVQVTSYGHPASTHGGLVDYVIGGEEVELWEAKHAQKVCSVYHAVRCAVWGDGVVHLCPANSACTALLRCHPCGQRTRSCGTLSAWCWSQVCLPA